MNYKVGDVLYYRQVFKDNYRNPLRSYKIVNISKKHYDTVIIDSTVNIHDKDLHYHILISKSKHYILEQDLKSEHPEYFL